MKRNDDTNAFKEATLRETIVDSALNAKPSKSAPAQSAELDRLAARIAGRLTLDNYSPVIITGMLRLAEFALLILAGLIICLLNIDDGIGAALLFYTPVILAGSILGILFLQFGDCYQVPALRSVVRTLPRALAGWTLACAMLAVYLFLVPSGVALSRPWFLMWYASGCAVFFVSRNFVAYAIKRWSRNGIMERRAVIVGGGEAAKQLIRAIEQDPENDIHICGLFDDRDERRSPAIVAGYPKLGNIDQLLTFARTAHIDMLIISMPLSAEARVLEFLKKLWVLPVDVRLAAHSNTLRFRPRAYSYAGSAPMLDIFDRPITDWDSVAKRIFDIVFSLIAIALLWPIMLGAAIAIKLDSKGPVIFRQKRHGFNNEEVDVFKFRSMYTDMCDPTARAAVTKGDPRVTKVGRFIRKTSIDELPQFFNVLRGDLSLVGPRPHAVTAAAHDRLFAEVVDGYFARHRVKPGVTGWAQINGWRGEIDNDEKIKRRTAFDLYYIENWSLLFDLKILFLTPLRLLNTENAY